MERFQSAPVAKTMVVHCKKCKHDVYIGRPSKWGNPFTIGRDGTRAEVIIKYRQWVVNQPRLMADIHELRGKKLGCWCSPKSCHGEVLVQLANARIAPTWEQVIGLQSPTWEQVIGLQSLTGE